MKKRVLLVDDEFDTQELAMLLISCGGVKLRVHSAFADQASTIVAEKPKQCAHCEK